MSQPELVREAALAALDDAGLQPSELDAVVLSNMELFEGRLFPELWAGEGAFAVGRPCVKVATGGTSGTSACIAAFHQVASGPFDVVLVVGFEKHSEGHTQAGMALTDPFWDRGAAAGALSNFALSVSQYAVERGVSPRQAALVAVKARHNAARNPHAHLAMPALTVEDVLASRLLAHPIRLLDMCPQSDGACALVVAAGDVARRRCPRPAWVRAAVTRHEQPYLGDIDRRLASMRTCATRRAWRTPRPGSASRCGTWTWRRSTSP